MISKIINYQTVSSASFQKKSSTEKKPQHNRPYEDHFVSNIKTSLPISSALAAFWTLIDSQNNLKTFPTNLVNNLACFLTAGIIISGIDSILKVRSQNKKVD